MALVKCKECDEKLSSTAKTCPSCGAKNRGPNGLKHGLIGLVAVIAFAWYIFSGDSHKEKIVQVDKTTRTMAVNKKEFGDEWAFTFDKGVLICDKQALWIENSITQRIYPLNGLAIDRTAWKLDEAWKESPNGDGTKMSLAPFIEKSQTLCK